MKTSQYEIIKENISQIIKEQELHNVKILVATKTHSDEKILQSAIINNSIIIGENRVQEALSKKNILDKFPNKKHFIGKLQKNKVRKAIQFFDVIETVDSVPLMERIDRIAKEEKKIMNIFLNINISNDEKKTGFTKEEGINLIKNYDFSLLKNIKITGLFTILQFGLTREEKRRYYREMKIFFNNIKKEINSPYFSDLSMGMSDDYEIAIKEGASIVRIGTKIFGTRQNKNL